MPDWKVSVPSSGAFLAAFPGCKAFAALSVVQRVDPDCDYRYTHTAPQPI